MVPFEMVTERDRPEQASLSIPLGEGMFRAHEGLANKTG